MPGWIYKSVARPYSEMLTDDELTKIGSLGFELVNILQVAQEVTVVGRQESRIMLHYIFKRHAPMAPKQQPPAAQA